jgi:hypothetical protein
MSEQQMAEENLAAVRGLLDRRESYREVFARAALIGGILSILTAAVMYLNDEVIRFLDRPVRPREFGFAWVDLFLLTAVVTVVFLYRAARDAADTFGSSRMKLALRTITPFALIPAAFTAWYFATGYLGAAELDLVTVWIAFYGLILLSTAFFAPRSIALLGWAFLLTGLGVPSLADRIDNWVGNAPTVLMGITFGVYHLVFGAVNWPRQKQKARSTVFAD